MYSMNKNVAVACGLGDLFVFLTRLDDFFLKNPEYSSLKYWIWLHHPKLAKELVSLDSHNVSVVSLDEMNQFLFDTVDPSLHEKLQNFLIKQNPSGVGVDKFLEYMGRFFPNIEQWVYLPVYEKYSSTYPYVLGKVIPKKTEKPYIVMHPFSTTVKTEKPERLWTPKRWGSIIRMLRDYYREFDIVIIGTSKDKIEGPRDFPQNVLDLRGKLSLTESIEYVYGASAVVGTNTWSSFMSAYAGIPTYTQWFVQQQLIPTHYPSTKMPKLFLYKKEEHPTVEEAWEDIRGLLDAGITF